MMSHKVLNLQSTQLLSQCNRNGLKQGHNVEGSY